MYCFQRLRALVGRSVAAAFALSALVGVSQATVWVTYDVRAVSASGTGINIVNGKDVKLLPTASGSVTLQLWAQINQLADGSHANDGMQAADGQFLSTNGNVNGVKGNFGSSVLRTEFAQFGSQPGTAFDYDADGDLDWGAINPGTFQAAASGTSGQTLRYRSTISTTIFSDEGAGTGVSSVLLGSINWSITGGLVLGNTADLNFNPSVNTATAAASKKVHVVTINGVTYSLGNNVSSTTPAGTEVGSSNNPLVAAAAPVHLLVVPEPASLALLGLGMAGVVFVARRRAA